MSRTTRAPARAGRFYPSDPDELRRTIEGHLEHDAPELQGTPKAIVAPHAGYAFSGAVAGRAYNAASPIADHVERVVLVGPSHFTRFEGLAASGFEAFETPLGETPLDRETLEALERNGHLQIAEAPHRDEHSLETHLPFVQRLFDDVEIVPVLTGEVSDEAVADLLESAWGGDETLVAISSDLSHYLDYETARQVDRRTCEAIESLDPKGIGRRDACGRTALRGLLRVAERRELDVETLELCNSGDTAGDRDEVVGYGAWVFEG